MTEKRFWYDFEDCTSAKIVDFKKDTEYALETIGDFRKIEDLLNEQVDKIVEQEIKIDFLQSENKHMRELVNENKKLYQENEQLKLELQRIYDITTVNKVKNIVEEIYDDLLYETSEKSDYAREMVLKCLEKIEGFGDDLE